MKHRPRWGLLTVGALIVMLLFTFPTWRKLITVRGGSANPDSATDAQREVLAGIRKVSGADAASTAYAALLTVVPAPTSDFPTPDGANGQAIKSGEFVTLDAIHMAKGKATLYRLLDNSLLLRFDDFTVINGPGLNVYLSTVSAPKTPAEMKTGQRHFLIGALKGTTGSQNYTRIPPELDLSRYKSVVIFSEDLNTVYSSAPLQ